MIRVERLQWNGVKPAVVFMIDRSGDFLQDQTRNQLRKGYHALIEREQGRYPIQVVHNNASVRESLDQLQESLRALIPQLKEVRWDAQPRLSRKPLEQLLLIPPNKGQVSVFTTLSPARPTVVYDTLWQFAAERQGVFFRKLEGCPPPWTQDPIMARHKFTNAYRASDRVSQYLIRHVIYEGDQSPGDVR